MSNTILLPFQPDAMAPAQLAAVSYLARYSGHTVIIVVGALRWSGLSGPRPTAGAKPEVAAGPPGLTAW
jgi:hypothetical protein